MTAQFNVHQVQQHVLRADGSTWRADSQDFFVVRSHDSHPSDVLEDADGSILVVDMGDWFNYGCPTSKIAKPEVKGTIYRIRRQDAAPPHDPWGNEIEWSSLSTAELVDLLHDARLRVQDRAVERLVQLGPDSVASLTVAYRTSTAPLVFRRRALWALSRIEVAEARAVVREALSDDETSLRHVALHCAGLHRDSETLPLLKSMVVADEPALRLLAAEALGRIGDAEAVPALLDGLRTGAVDRFLEHALIYALIQIGDRQATLPALDDPSPFIRRAGLIALEQMAIGKLTVNMVTSCLNTDDPQLQKAALEIFSTYDDDWSEEIIWWLNAKWLAVEQPSDELQMSVAGALIALSPTDSIQKLVADVMSDPKTQLANRLLLLEVMARCRLDELPERWLEALAAALSHENPRVCSEAVATIRSRSLTQFELELSELVRTSTLPTELRVMSLECVTGRQEEMPADWFEFLTAQLNDDVAPLLAASAARALRASPLNDTQLIKLADDLARVGPLLVPHLVPAYQQSRSVKVGQALISALARSPGSESLTADELNQILKESPDEVRQAARPLLDKLTARDEQQAAHLAEIKARMAQTEGDVQRGRSVFWSKQTACISCHRMDDEGGRVGPDLSKIAQLRRPDDLIESLIFPSSSIALGYRPHSIAMTDGRDHTGLIVRETSEAIYLRTSQLAEVRIPRSHVEAMRPSDVSIMPQGLEKTMTTQQLSDLLAFLSQRREE